MKTILALFASAACLLIVSYHAGAQATNPPEALFLTANLLPPQNGMYLGAPGSRIVFSNGIVLSNIIAHHYLPGFPPAPAGLSVTRTFRGQLDMDISFDHGTNFIHSAGSNICSVNLQGMSPANSGPQSYDTEMLQLDISDGNLPSGMMIRESPTLPSTGQTQVSPTPGGFMVSSFFDIFTELSLDGGQTWTPATQAMHLDLRVDPTQTGVTGEPAPLMPPPNDQYTSIGQGFAFASGLVLKDMRFKYFGQAVDPTVFPLGSNQVIGPLSATLDCRYSLDGGSNFRSARIPAQLTVRIMKSNPGSPVAGPHPWPWIFYDTELLQMDLAGGDLPANLVLRESPSLPSYGETGILPNSDGSFQFSSFFDVFAELNVAGAWQPQSNAPARLELQRPGFQFQYPSTSHPPTNSSYLADSEAVVRYTNSNVIISNLTLFNFVVNFPPPPIGPPVEDFPCTASFMFSMNGGQTFSNATAPALGMLMINGGQGAGGAQYFNTEMIQLNISGGTLPPGMFIRESPTKASLGRMSITPTQAGTGTYRIDSFFDIFTELSMDGGQTWATQSSSPATVALYPKVPPIARLGVICPSDLTVFTGDPSGAFVNFSFGPQLFPDCPFGPFTITCVPASGSKFPLGTTTVNCTRTDGCGEKATCSFNVTVIQNFIYFGPLAHSVLGSAVLSVINTGAPQPSLVISNLGAGGNDGVHLNLGAVDSVYFQYAPFNTATEPIVSTCIVHQATGPYALDPNHVLGIGTFFGGSNSMVSADFASIGATQVLAQVMDESNHLIKSMLLPNASWVALNSIFPPPCSNYNKTAYTYAQGKDFIWYRFCMYGCTCVGTNCWIERVICFRPDIALAALPNHLSGIDLRAQGPQPPATLTILSEQTGKFGNLHEYKGMATSESQPGLFFSDNIGPSGTDGLAVDLMNVSHFDMALAPTRIQAQGTCWKMAALGQFNGQTNTQLGVAVLTHSVGPGGGCDVAVDFSSISASQVQVDIYQGSQFVGTSTMPTGHVGTIFGNGNLTGCGKLGPPLPCYWMSFDSTFLFQSANGPSFQGDQIRLLAANPGGQIQSLSQFSVQGCALGQFVVVGESNSPPVELDTFPLPQAQMTLAIPMPGGGFRVETVNLTGTAAFSVSVGPGGQCGDSNNNGLDDASVQMTALTLTGTSSMGPVQVTLAPAPPSLGMIEEQTNLVPGILDLQPFTPSGTANSFFDIFFNMQVGPGPSFPVPLQLHNGPPLHIASIITHKPPGPGDSFTSTNPPMELLYNTGQPSGIQLISGILVPNCIPPTISVSKVTNGKLTFCWPALCGTDFQVQCGTNLIPPINWQGITNAVINTNGQFCVTVDISPGGRFYRITR